MKAGHLLARMRGIHAALLGVPMLDEYVYGEASEVSPEAPALVVRVARTSLLPGGIANVARNILAFGAHPTVVGPVGLDESGALLERVIEEHGLETSHLARADRFSTTRRTRIFAGHAQQVLRVDRVGGGDLSDTALAEVLRQFDAALEGAHVALVSGSCGLPQNALRTAVERAGVHGVPVVASPGRDDLPAVEGAQTAVFNRTDAAAALGIRGDLVDSDALDAAEALRQTGGFETVVVTLGASGMAVSGPEALRIQAPRHEVYDTSGAGDTVFAAIGLGISASGWSPELFHLAAAASAKVVLHLGAAPPSEADLASIALH
jgi:rfaE bifunctional protein kinase chain/domain